MPQAGGMPPMGATPMGMMNPMMGGAAGMNPAMMGMSPQMIGGGQMGGMIPAGMPSIPSMQTLQTMPGNGLPFLERL